MFLKVNVFDIIINSLISDIKTCNDIVTKSHYKLELLIIC